MSLRIKRHLLKFKKPAGTSRGVMLDKPSWFLSFNGESGVARGEVSVIPGLSVDNLGLIESTLVQLHDLSITELESEIPNLGDFPAIRFGLEMLLKDYHNGCKQQLFDNDFARGEGIAINGLVWMGEFDFMYEQIKQKIETGYKCIKIKIAAIDWNKEIELLKYIRKHFSVEDIQIRVDANGGFKNDEAFDKLNHLAQLDVHSIEQPIKQDQWDEMAKLCSITPIPIALDEELIGRTDINLKKKMLSTIQPQYIILKPSLVGGFKASEEWIELAASLGIDYWVTSALESNVGLNAIAQWTAGLNNKHYQGLGTGQLYTNNIPSPLFIESGFIYSGNDPWDFSILDN